MLKIKWLSFIMLMVVMTGCATKEYVYVRKTVYVKPPDILIKDTTILPKLSISKEEYITTDPLTREKALTEYSIDLMGVIHKYKLKNERLESWYKDVNATVSN